jgi:hypothetical protein
MEFPEMMIIREQSVIVFSASKSENKCEKVIKFFDGKEKSKCSHWKDLFINANDSKNRLILNMLIKKIPTFDFAIILSDSTDILEQEVETKELCAQGINLKEIFEQRIEYEDGEVKKRFIRKYVMRDNVLFECGLCIMALGSDRVIFLREKNTYIPLDLFSGLQKMGIKTFEYANNLPNNFENTLEEVEKYIKGKASQISPIVIGASISTADAYLSNFILRFWENIEKEGKMTGCFEDLDSKEIFHPNISQIRMYIFIPDKINSSLSKDIYKFYNDYGFKRGIVISENAFRGVEFRYKVDGDKYIICDYPSTLTASFNTVNEILNLNADEKIDDGAIDRFLKKERDSFLYTLKKLMKEESLKSKLESFKKNEAEIEETFIRMKQVKIVELESTVDSADSSVPLQKIIV